MSFQNIVKAGSTPCLLKVKNKAQEFCYGVGDGKNIYLKSIIHFRAVYFPAGLYCYYLLDQQSNGGEEKKLLPQLVLHHSCYMDKMAFMWQSTQNCMPVEVQSLHTPRNTGASSIKFSFRDIVVPQMVLK